MTNTEFEAMDALQKEAARYRESQGEVFSHNRPRIATRIIEIANRIYYSPQTSADKESTADMLIELFLYADRIGFSLVGETVKRLAELKAKDDTKG